MLGMGSLVLMEEQGLGQVLQQYMRGGGVIKEVSGGVGAGHLGAGGGAGVGGEAAVAGAGEVGQQEPAPVEVEESLDSDEFLLAQMAAYDEDPVKYGIEARALFPRKQECVGPGGAGISNHG